MRNGGRDGDSINPNKMRQTLHIEGSKADDCFKSFCCKPCAICQMWGQLDPDFDPDDSDNALCIKFSHTHICATLMVMLIVIILMILTMLVMSS